MYPLRHVSIVFLAVLATLVSSGQSIGPGPLWAAVPAAEKNALTDLYAATNGPGWFNNDGWDNAARPDPCENHWYHVVCDPTLTHVTQLNLPANNLVGYIPASLGSLSRLEYLGLYDNDLSGPIPASLGNLQYLQRLDLRHNHLSGVIPSSLGSMTGLRYLYLSENNFSGEIPPMLGNLLQLQELWLDSNELSGIIPSSLGNMTGLQYLYLYENNLSGEIPSSLGELSQLRRLLLQNNVLCGIVPSSLTNLTQLEDDSGLFLQFNRLLTKTDPALAAFIIQKSGSDYWTKTQDSHSCFFWPEFLPALIPH